MTTTITPITSPVPAKTSGQSWDDFAEALKNASEAEASRLMSAIPTPPITADRSSDEWLGQYQAQRVASDKRSYQEVCFDAKLIVSIGQALADEVSDFNSLDISYAGSGDNGEDSEFNVYLNRPILLDDDGNRRRYTAAEHSDLINRENAATALLTGDLCEWMDETAWGIAYNSHPGFEIDAGGFGTLSVARADGDDSSPLQLTISHTQRVEETYADEVLA